MLLKSIVAFFIGTFNWAISVNFFCLRYNIESKNRLDRLFNPKEQKYIYMEERQVKTVEIEKREPSTNRTKTVPRGNRSVGDAINEMCKTS